MSRSVEQRANIVFDELITAYMAGRSPKLEEYLSRCPTLEQARIQEAFAGFTFAYDTYHACQISEETVRSAMERLQHVRQRRQKLADAKNRAMLESWDQVVMQPLIQLKNLLYPGLDAASGQVAVMNRVVPGTASVAGTRPDQYARKSAEQIARIGAERLLSRASIDSIPVPLSDIAEQLCLFVQEASLKNTEGCLVTDGDTGGILLNSDIPDRCRKKFTFAHEIGHYILHRGNQRLFSDQEKDLFSPSSKIEMEASAFASYLLMPPALLPPSFGRDIPNLAMAEGVSESFDVSLMAALKRLVQESNYQTIFVCSEGQRIKWFNFSPEVQGYNSVISQLPQDSAARILFKNASVDTCTKRLPAGAWFDKGWLADEKLQVVEESRRFPSGYIYTLINIEYNEG